MSNIKINYSGRLGNHIIMYLMGVYFAEKNNIYFQSKIPDQNFYNFFEIDIPRGEEQKEYDETILIDDNNVEELLFNNKTSNKNIVLGGYFQSPNILGNPNIENKYKKYISPKKIENTLDLYVHVRLGDILGRHSLPYEYYENRLKNISFENGIITSDTPNHPIVEKIIKKYNLKLFCGEPAETIALGSQCKNIVLSAGTFSFLSAYYSKKSNVFYIDNKKMKKYFDINPWGPNIFSIFSKKENFFNYE